MEWEISGQSMIVVIELRLTTRAWWIVDDHVNIRFLGKEGPGTTTLAFNQAHHKREEEKSGLENHSDGESLSERYVSVSTEERKLRLNQGGHPYLNQTQEQGGKEFRDS